MTGSLTVKDGKYYAILNLYVDGKRKKKWIGTGLPEKGNKRKAEKFLRDTLRQYEENQGILSSEVQFTRYLTIWREKMGSKVDIITLQGYDSLINAHIRPYFAEKNLPLHRVDREVLQRYIDEKRTSGKLDGSGGLSARSLRLHKNILNQVLDMAVENKLISSNPCKFLDMPKTERFQSRFYTVQQMQTLFKAIQGEPIAPMVKITALYGLRRSELLGIQWDSICFDTGTLTIRHTVSKVTRTVAKDKTKNASSFRSYPLTPEAIEIFRHAKAEEQRNKKLMGKEYQENSYVFKWPDGHPFSPDYVSHRFRDLLKKHGLPHIRFHELRHSCASILLSQGNTLKDVQEWLGHADIKMTANIYGHLDVARKKSLADQLTAGFTEANPMQVVEKW